MENPTDLQIFEKAFKRYTFNLKEEEKQDLLTIANAINHPSDPAPSTSKSSSYTPPPPPSPSHDTIILHDHNLEAMFEEE